MTFAHEVPAAPGVIRLCVPVRGLVLAIEARSARLSTVIYKNRVVRRVPKSHVIAVAVEDRAQSFISLLTSHAELTLGSVSFEMSINQGLKVAATFGLRTLDERRELA